MLRVKLIALRLSKNQKPPSQGACATCSKFSMHVMDSISELIDGQVVALDPFRLDI